MPHRLWHFFLFGSVDVTIFCGSSFGNFDSKMCCEQHALENASGCDPLLLCAPGQGVHVILKERLPSRDHDRGSADSH